VPSNSKHQAKASLGSKAINDGQKTAKTKVGPQGDEQQIENDQIFTRNNELVSSTKSLLNSQRIPNLENKLNGLTVVQQNKMRA